MNIRRNILIKNIQIFENIRHTLVWRSLNNIGILAYPRKASEATMQCEDLFMADDDLFLDAHCRDHHLPYICPNCQNWESRNSLIRMEFSSSHCVLVFYILRHILAQSDRNQNFSYTIFFIQNLILFLPIFFYTESDTF